MQTIAELAKHYQKSEKAIRYAFKHMVKLNQLKKDADYQIVDFKDDQHFRYLIDPGRFDALFKDPKNQTKAEQFDTQKIDISTKLDNKNNDSGIKDDYIETLKTQLEVKDNQIEQLQESVKMKDQLNEKLNHALLLLTQPKESREEIKYEPIDAEFENTPKTTEEINID